MEPQNSKNHKHLQKLIIKTHPQSTPAKRLRLEGVKPLKLTTVIHFDMFLQRHSAHKREVKWHWKLSLRATKIRKNNNHEHSKKQRERKLQKVGYCCDSAPKWD